MNEFWRKGLKIVNHKRERATNYKIFIVSSVQDLLLSATEIILV
jgi:hypothetical protein